MSVFTAASLLFGNIVAATTSQSTEPIRLPVTLVKANPVTTIAVGDRPVQAVVDTLGGMLTLSRDVIEVAGGVKLPDRQHSNDALGNKYVHARYRMPLIEIGGRALRDIVVIEAAQGEFGGGGPAVPNSIGRSFLSQYFVVVDYAGGAITLWSPDPGNAERAKCGRTRIPMEKTEEEELAVSVFDTPSGRLRLGWDTGAQYSVLPVAMAEKFRRETITRGTTEFYQPSRLEAAGRNFAPLEFVLLPLQAASDFHGILGSNFFAKHVVCFDYVNREVRVR